MASVYGVNQALLNGGYQVKASELGGEIKMAYDKFTFSANVFALNDLIELALYIPQGAMVVGAFIKSPSLGTTGAFQLGTAADPDALVIADCSGAAVLAKETAASADLFKIVSSADKQQYILKCTEATDAANGLTIEAGIFYKMI